MAEAVRPRKKKKENRRIVIRSPVEVQNKVSVKEDPKIKPKSATDSFQDALSAKSNEDVINDLETSTCVKDDSHIPEDSVKQPTNEDLDIYKDAESSFHDETTTHVDTTSTTELLKETDTNHDDASLITQVSNTEQCPNYIDSEQIFQEEDTTNLSIEVDFMMSCSPKNAEDINVIVEESIVDVSEYPTEGVQTEVIPDSGLEQTQVLSDISSDVEINLPAREVVKADSKEKTEECLEGVHKECEISPDIQPLTASNVISQNFMLSDSAQMTGEILQPFNDIQLSYLYTNPELMHLEDFIEDFIKEGKGKEESEFYELVLSYWKCRISLVKCHKKIQTIRSRWHNERADVWQSADKSLNVTRPCRDGIYCSQDIPYKWMEFCNERAIILFGHLKEISTIAYEELLLRQYNTQMARLRIDSHLCLLHSSCKDIVIGSSDIPVSGLLPRQLSPDLIKYLCGLRDSITVLFMFKRRQIDEEGFVKDVDAWIQRLVGILLRVGSLPDQFFVLNHILRCPPGSVAPLAHMIQFPSFELLCSNVGFWDSPLVHHFIVMVATVTLPTRGRKEFLEKYNIPSTGNENAASNWTFVEEDREEDEDQEDCLYLLQENDLVAMFDQLPIEELFFYLLKITRNDCGEPCYDMTKFTSNEMARILAFGSCLVTLLGRIFDTYNYLRYRQFLKRVSQTVRLIVQLISFHWSCYCCWRLEICGDTFKDTPVFMSVHQQFSIERLQLEFDQFFFRGAHQIMSSKSAGTWQFLASMPYSAISSDAVLNVMSKFIRRNTAFTSDMSVESMLADVSTMIPGEAIFLLSALANMATARPIEDRSFIEKVCLIEFEIAFVLKSTKDFCCKDGRNNLANIAAHHPFVISFILDYVQSKVTSMKEDILSLFKVLPLDKWTPLDVDVNNLRKWLLHTPIVSAEHQLARLILKHLNYGTVEDDSSVLFLPREFHCVIALLLVDVNGCTFPNHPGGLLLIENDNPGIIGQVSKLAVTSYNKIIHPHAQQEFNHWLWEVALSLKLHDNDQPEDRNASRRETLVDIGESRSKETNAGWYGKCIEFLSPQSVSELELEHSVVLLNLKRACQSLGSLASYVSIAMSSIGHSRAQFLNVGLERLAVLLQNLCHNAILRLISLVIPLLVKEMDISMEIEGFFSLIDAVIHIDARQAGYAERVWQYPEPGIYSQQLAGIIVRHIAPSSKPHDNSDQLAKFWFSALTRVNMWRRDFTVQYLMDCLSKAIFSAQSDIIWFQRLFRYEFESLVTSQLPRGLLSSVMSWIANANAVTLLDLKADSQWSYFAYYALCTETALEIESGLWREITDEALLNPKLSFEAKYKRAVSNIKSTYIPPLEYLSIYRWADLALATHVDHPLLPLIWQKFFQLFLFRVPLPASGSDFKSGVGYQFFQAFHYSSKAKRMKAHLHATSAHHHEKSQDNANEDNMIDKGHLHDAVLHERLSGLYQTLALWLEESRLHDAHISLESLPLVYWPEGLQNIFNGCQNPWMEYVDVDCIRNELSVLESLWSATIYETHRGRHQHSMRRDEASSDEVKMLNKLTRKSNRLEAPTFVIPNSPVPPIKTSMLLQRATLIQAANHDLERFVVFAKKTSSLQANHVALDEEYSELLPALYENVNKNVMVTLECHQRKRVCTGPAETVISVSEPLINDSIARLLHFNRDQWLQLLDTCMEPLEEGLCIGAMHVERIVTSLVNAHMSCTSDDAMSIRDTGIGLFYLLAQLIDDDIKRCHPAIQFFSSSVEVLGKEFIAISGEEQMPLLESILRHHSSVTCVAPFFSPNIYPERFPTLYSMVAGSIEVSSVSKYFVLLSKFDVRDWLLAGPPIQDRVSMIKFIFGALGRFGVSPSNDSCLVLDLMRSHFQLILTHRFPEIYSECLRQLVAWSASSDISVECWDDLIYCIGGNPVEHTVRRGTGSMIEPCLLKPYECRDTLQWFATYFSSFPKVTADQCIEHYRIWKPCVRQLTRLLFFLHDIASSLFKNEDSAMHERDCQQAWDSIAAIYSVWIAPSGDGVAWSIEYSNEAVSFLQSFIEAVRFTSEKLQTPEGYSCLLSTCWMYFLHILSPAFSATHAADVYFSLLPSLPWKMFWPTLIEVDAMIKLTEDSSPMCCFIATLVPLIPWQQILNFHAQRDDLKILSEYHAGLFSLFLRLAAKKEAVSKSSSKLGALYESYGDFIWKYMLVEDIEKGCNAFIKTVDPSFILSLNLFGRQTLGLIKYVCAFKEPIDNTNVGKRLLYVKIVGNLLERCVTKKGLKISTVTPIVTALLHDVDEFANAAPSSSHDEVHDMIVALLKISNRYHQDASMGSEFFIAIRDYVAATSNQSFILLTISASWSSLESAQQQVELVETAINAYFGSTLSPKPDYVHHVPTWQKVSKYVNIPSGKVDVVLKEAIKRHSILLLYARNVQRLTSQSISSDNLEVVLDTIQCLACITPCSCCETKIILLWHQVLHTLHAKITIFGDKLHGFKLGKYVMNMAHTCQSHGEDRTYTGFLGVIGIGRKSILPLTLRFCARSLHLFLLCQLPASGVPLRLKQGDPGAILNPRPRTSMPTQESVKTLESFKVLLRNRSYLDMGSHIEWVLRFVTNSETSLSSGELLTTYFYEQFYRDIGYVSAAFRN